MKRWESVREEVRKVVGPFSEIRPDTSDDLSEAVARSFRGGERRFIAAGGDGTVNSVVSSLMPFAGTPGFPEVAFGAIGLGSSNDFHKGSERAGGLSNPFRIDFERLRAHDVGRIDAVLAGSAVRKYFIVNASLGVTAEGNAVFNRSTGIMPLLKRVSTDAAIAWAALSAIITHVNTDVEVSFIGEDEGKTGDGGNRLVRLSNLSIMKNPNISGGFRANVSVSCDDGRLGVWLEENLSRFGLLKLLISMAAGNHGGSGRPSAMGNPTMGGYRSLHVSGNDLFPVEYDGEVFFSNDVTFSLIPTALKVCQ